MRAFAALIGYVLNKMKTILKKVIGKYLNKRGYALVNAMRQIGRARAIDVFDTPQTNDHIRLSTLELCAHEIRRRNVPGSCAELGVYQGYFASKINQLFPERRLHLFDTFQGFDNEEVAHEKASRGLRHQRDFSDTSVAAVLAKMPSPARCEIHKGFFPGTAEGVEDRFALVSLDADLHDPIKAGLHWFWPRMERYGFILIHDYNNAKWPGAKLAVTEFCSLKQLSLVPVSDAFGTAIITKTD